ncbi:MAG: hypothetical protein AAFZ05_09170, partial [Pseudomonadota bacterium]
MFEQTIGRGLAGFRLRVGAAVLLAAMTVGAGHPASAEQAKPEAAPPASAKPSSDSVIPGAFAAEQRAKLDRLFARLAGAPNRSKGEAVVQEIWRTWMTSGNVDVD